MNILRPWRTCKDQLAFLSLLLSRATLDDSDEGGAAASQSAAPISNPLSSPA